MSHVNRLTVLLSAIAVAVLLLVSPAAATEAGGGESGGGETTQSEEGEGGGGGEERDKIELAETPHEWVGLVLIALLGIAALLALDNARRQLKGERRQATGEWRWR